MTSDAAGKIGLIQPAACCTQRGMCLKLVAAPVQKLEGLQESVKGEVERHHKALQVTPHIRRCTASSFINTMIASMLALVKVVQQRCDDSVYSVRVNVQQ